jgi:transmembrane sensor
VDELILRILSGAASLQEEERLAGWRREAPDHEAHFQQVCRVWEVTGPPRVAELDDAALDLRVAEVMKAAQKRREAGSGWSGLLAAASRSAPPKAGRRRDRLSLSRWLPMGVAGGVALAAALAALALGLGSRAGSRDAAEPGEPPRDAWTGSDTPSVLDLADGSVVLLAPGARLASRMEAGARRIWLEGRAFFAVVPDPARPFLVQVGDSRVGVLGTRFEVDEREEGVRAVVVEGRVRLSSPRGEVVVPGGSVGMSEPQSAPAAQAVDDVLALLDWPEGTLAFRGTALAVVAREVGRYFGAHIEIRGASLRGRAISATFREESLGEVLETLCAVAAARCASSEGSIVMSDREGRVP